MKNAYRRSIATGLLFAQLVSNASALAQALTIRLPIVANNATISVIKAPIAVGNLRKNISGYVNLDITNDTPNLITLGTLYQNDEISVAGGSCVQGTQLASGSSCYYTLIVTPSVTNNNGSWARAMAVDVTMPDTTVQSWSYNITGTVTAASLFTNSIDPFVVNSTTKASTITVTNNNNYDLYYSSIDTTAIPTAKLSGSTCSGIIAAGTSCTLSFKKSTSTATGSGLIKFIQSAGNSVSEINTVVGTLSQQMTLTSTPSFTVQTLRGGSVVNYASLTYKNTGSVPAGIVATPSGSGVGIVSNDCQNIAVGGTCTINTNFDPTGLAVGAYTGKVILTYSDNSALNTYITSSTVLDDSEKLTTSITDLNYGNVILGGSSQNTVTLTNTGNVPVTVTNIDVPSTEFDIAGSTCTNTLIPGQACSFTNTFTPSALAAFSGYVKISTSKTANLANYSVEGVGVGANIVADTNGVVFQGQQGVSTSKDVVYTNNSSYSTTITTLATSGPDSSWLSIVKTDCINKTMSPGQTCSATLSANSSVSTASSNLKIVYNQGLTVWRLPVSGTFAAPQPYLAVSDIVCQNAIQFSPISSYSAALNKVYSKAGSCSGELVNTSSNITSTITAISNILNIQTVSGTSGVNLVKADLYTNGVLSQPNVSLSNVLSLAPQQKLVFSFNYDVSSTGTFSNSYVAYGLPDGQSINKPIAYTVTSNNNNSLSTLSCPTTVYNQLSYMCSASFTNNSAIPVEVKSVVDYSGTTGLSSDWSNTAQSRLVTSGSCIGAVLANGQTCSILIKFNIQNPVGSLNLPYGLALNTGDTVQNSGTVNVLQHSNSVTLGSFVCNNPYPGQSGTCVATVTNNNNINLLNSSDGLAQVQFTTSSFQNLGLVVDGFSHNCTNNQIRPLQSCTVQITYHGTDYASSNISVEMDSIVTVGSDVVNESMTQQASLLVNKANIGVTVVCPATYIGKDSACIGTINNNSLTDTYQLTNVQTKGDQGIQIINDNTAATLSPGSSKTVPFAFNSNSTGSYSASISATVNGFVYSAATQVAVEDIPDSLKLKLSNLNCNPVYYFSTSNSTDSNYSYVTQGTCSFTALNGTAGSLSFDPFSNSLSMSGQLYGVVAVKWYDSNGLEITVHDNKTIGAGESAIVTIKSKSDGVIGQNPIGVSYANGDGTASNASGSLLINNPINKVSISEYNCPILYEGKPSQCVNNIINNSTVPVLAQNVVDSGISYGSNSTDCTNSLLLPGSVCHVKLNATFPVQGAYSATSGLDYGSLGQKSQVFTLNVIKYNAASMTISDPTCDITPLIGQQAKCSLTVKNNAVYDANNPSLGQVSGFKINAVSSIDSTSLSVSNLNYSCDTIVANNSCTISYSYTPQTYYSSGTITFSTQGTMQLVTSSEKISASNISNALFKEPNVSIINDPCQGYVAGQYSCIVTVQNNDAVSYNLTNMTVLDSNSVPLSFVASASTLDAGKSVKIVYEGTIGSAGVFNNSLLFNLAGKPVQAALPVTGLSSPVPSFSSDVTCPASVFLFDKSKSCVVSITNTSLFDGYIKGVGSSNTANMPVDINAPDYNGCSNLIGSGQTCKYTVNINPDKVGTLSASFVGTVYNKNSTSSIAFSKNLTTTVVIPDVLATITPQSTIVVNAPSSAVITLKNNSSIDLSNMQLTPSTTASDVITVDSTLSTCTGSLSKGQTCSLVYNWTPIAKGSKTLNVVITSDQYTATKSATYFVNTATLSVLPYNNLLTTATGNNSNSGNWFIIQNTGTVDATLMSIGTNSGKVTIAGAADAKIGLVPCVVGNVLKVKESCSIRDTIIKTMSTAELLLNKNYAITGVTASVKTNYGSVISWPLNYDVGVLQLDVPQQDVLFDYGINKVSGFVHVTNLAGVPINKLNIVSADTTLKYDLSNCTNLAAFGKPGSYCDLGYTYTTSKPSVTKLVPFKINGTYAQSVNGAVTTGTLETVNGYGYFNIRQAVFNAVWSTPSILDTIKSTASVFDMTITNNSADPFVINQLSIGGTDKLVYQIINDPCSGKELTQNQTCTVSVSFTPNVYRADPFVGNITATTNHGVLTSANFSGKAIDYTGQRFVDLSASVVDQQSQAYTTTQTSAGYLVLSITNPSAYAVPVQMLANLTRYTMNGSSTIDLTNPLNKAQFDLGDQLNIGYTTVESMLFSDNIQHSVTCTMAGTVCDPRDVLYTGKSFQLKAKSTVTVTIKYDMATKISANIEAKVLDSNYIDSNLLNNKAQASTQANPYLFKIGAGALSTQQYNNFIFGGNYGLVGQYCLTSSVACAATASDLMNYVYSQTVLASTTSTCDTKWSGQSWINLYWSVSQPVVSNYYSNGSFAFHINKTCPAGSNSPTGKTATEEYVANIPEANSTSKPHGFVKNMANGFVIAIKDETDVKVLDPGTYEMYVPVGTSVNNQAWLNMLGYGNVLADFYAVMLPDTRMYLWSDYFDISVTSDFTNTATPYSDVESYKNKLNYYWQSGSAIDMLSPVNKGYIGSNNSSGIKLPWAIKSNIYSGSTGALNSQSNYAFLGSLQVSAQATDANRYVGPFVTYKFNVPEVATSTQMSVAFAGQPKADYSANYNKDANSINSAKFTFKNKPVADVSVVAKNPVDIAYKGTTKNFAYIIANKGSYPVTGLFTVNSSVSTVPVYIGASGITSKQYVIPVGSSITVVVTAVIDKQTSSLPITALFTQTSNDTIDNLLSNNTSSVTYAVLRGSNPSLALSYSTASVRPKTIVPVSVTVSNTGTLASDVGTINIAGSSGIEVYSDNGASTPVSTIAVPAIIAGSQFSTTVYMKAQGVSSTTAVENVSYTELGYDTLSKPVSIVTNSLPAFLGYADIALSTSSDASNLSSTSNSTNVRVKVVNPASFEVDGYISLSSDNYNIALVSCDDPGFSCVGNGSNSYSVKIAPLSTVSMVLKVSPTDAFQGQIATGTSSSGVISAQWTQTSLSSTDTNSNNNSKTEYISFLKMSSADIATQNIKFTIDWNGSTYASWDGRYYKNGQPAGFYGGNIYAVISSDGYIYYYGRTVTFRDNNAWDLSNGHYDGWTNPIYIGRIQWMTTVNGSPLSQDALNQFEISTDSVNWQSLAGSSITVSNTTVMDDYPQATVPYSYQDDPAPYQSYIDYYSSGDFIYSQLSSLNSQIQLRLKGSATIKQQFIVQSNLYGLVYREHFCVGGQPMYGTINSWGEPVIVPQYYYYMYKDAGLISDENYGWINMASATLVPGSCYKIISGDNSGGL